MDCRTAWPSWCSTTDRGIGSGNPRRKKQFDTDDAGNNVQVIRWDDAAAGSYVIQVTAANLLPRSAGQSVRPQHFALVVSGSLSSGYRL